MKPVLVILGTRPEAIKLAPVIAELRSHPVLNPVVCLTGQHGSDMVDPILDFFDIEPDEQLDVMRPDQSLSMLSATLLKQLERTFDRVNPEAVLVQGDTTSCLMGALSGYYRKVMIGHVEAGLRSGSLASPFPEEANRQMVSRLANLHFAPTEQAAEALYAENIGKSRVTVTGNTVIDALLQVVARNRLDGVDVPTMLWPERRADRRYVLVTLHRREVLGETIRDMLGAIVDLAARRPETDVVLIGHPNPGVQKAIMEVCAAAKPNFNVIPPQPYRCFIDLMAHAHLVLSDSGGIQEEAPSLDRPVLVLRDRTERNEGVEAGCLVRVGTRRSAIVDACEHLLDDEKDYARIAAAPNPYGDGKAAARICEVLATCLGT